MGGRRRYRMCLPQEAGEKDRRVVGPTGSVGGLNQALTPHILLMFRIQDFFNLFMGHVGGETVGTEQEAVAGLTWQTLYGRIYDVPLAESLQNHVPIRVIVGLLIRQQALFVEHVHDSLIIGEQYEFSLRK
jgi:hypothetical protein